MFGLVVSEVLQDFWCEKLFVGDLGLGHVERVADLELVHLLV